MTDLSHLCWALVEAAGERLARRWRELRVEEGGDVDGVLAGHSPPGGGGMGVQPGEGGQGRGLQLEHRLRSISTYDRHGCGIKNDNLGCNVK